MDVFGLIARDDNDDRSPCTLDTCPVQDSYYKCMYSSFPSSLRGSVATFVYDVFNLQSDKKER